MCHRNQSFFVRVGDKHYVLTYSVLNDWLHIPEEFMGVKCHDISFHSPLRISGPTSILKVLMPSMYVLTEDRRLFDFSLNAHHEKMTNLRTNFLRTAFPNHL